MHTEVFKVKIMLIMIVFFVLYTMVLEHFTNTLYIFYVIFIE